MAQINSVQDIFGGVPLHYGLRASALFMDSSGQFSQVRVDYDRYGKITYKLNFNVPFPNSAKEVIYEKWAFETKMDSAVIDSCLRYASSVTLFYSSKAKARTDLSKVRTYLVQFTFAKSETTVFDKKGNPVSYQLAPSSGYLCNFLELKRIDKHIQLTYH